MKGAKGAKDKVKRVKVPPARSHLVFDKYLDTIYPIVTDSEMNLAYSSNLLQF